MRDAGLVKPRRFQFVLWDGGGNVPPQLAVARRLVERGHDVRVLAPRSLERRVEAAGCAFAPYVHAPEHDSASPDGDILRDWEPRTPVGAAARVRDRLMARPASLFARDVLETVERDPADAVVIDYMLLGAYAGAERAALPAATLIHHIYPLPDPALPPFGFGLRPARHAPDRVRDALLRRVFARFYAAALPPLNDARIRLGLDPLDSIFDLFLRPERVLVLTSRAFDFPAAALPGNVRYVGAQVASLPGTGWQGPWEQDEPRPLVVVSFSTTYQRQGDILQRVIDALGDLPVRGLVTAGPAAASLEARPNVVVRAYVPHEQVVPQADLVITHGGHGTVMTAMASGVPVLCLPMGRDQADVAARAEWRGAGLTIASRSKPAAIRAAVERILAETGFRAAAAEVAGGIARADGESSAVDELEAVAHAGSPASLARAS